MYCLIKPFAVCVRLIGGRYADVDCAPLIALNELLSVKFLVDLSRPYYRLHVTTPRSVLRGGSQVSGR